MFDRPACKAETASALFRVILNSIVSFHILTRNREDKGAWPPGAVLGLGRSSVVRWGSGRHRACGSSGFDRVTVMVSGFTMRGSLVKPVQGSALLFISGSYFKIKKLGKETTQ